jgi:hypothetical protein
MASAQAPEVRGPEPPADRNQLTSASKIPFEVRARSRVRSRAYAPLNALSTLLSFVSAAATHAVARALLPPAPSPSGAIIHAL